MEQSQKSKLKFGGSGSGRDSLSITKDIQVPDIEAILRNAKQAIAQASVTISKSRGCGCFGDDDDD